MFKHYSAVLTEISGKEAELQKSKFLNELSIRLEWAGITDVNNKIYVQPLEISNIAFFMFLFTVPQLHKLYFCKNTGKQRILSLMISFNFSFYALIIYW